MATPWNTADRPTWTTYAQRPGVSTDWWASKLWGAYLVDSLGRFITDSLGRRIVVIVAGWSLEIDITTWTPRTPI